MALNRPENAWINCSNYAKILSMPRYCYNGIVTIVTVIILEFLSAQFEHPDVLLLFYLSLTKIRT